MLLILSERIRHDTGNEKLADEARNLAGASHDYVPTIDPEPLAAKNDEWCRRFSSLMYPKPKEKTK
jgi:hypothetical protein